MRPLRFHSVRHSPSLPLDGTGASIESVISTLGHDTRACAIHICAFSSRWLPPRNSFKSLGQRDSAYSRQTLQSKVKGFCMHTCKCAYTVKSLFGAWRVIETIRSANVRVNQNCLGTGPGIYMIFPLCVAPQKAVAICHMPARGWKTSFGFHNLCDGDAFRVVK